MRKRKRKKHTGFWMDVDGESVHVLGDPDMEQETVDALTAMVRAVRKAVEDGTLKKDTVDGDAEAGSGGEDYHE